MLYQSIDPYTGEVWGQYATSTEEELAQCLTQAERGFKQWRKWSFAARGEVVMKAADLLLARKEHYARLISAEMGKPLAQSLAEVEKCAWVCRHYAQQAAILLQGRTVPTEARLSEVVFQPLGTILQVMPWNFPFWQVFRFAAPALMAGNTCWLKHAPNVPQCALAIAALWREAGTPEGVFQQSFLDAAQVERLLVRESAISGLAFTGSVRAGSQLGAWAGQGIKKAVLELGGSDAWIVLDDADLEQAVRLGAQSRLQNTGQTCVSAKRFILHERIAQRFIEQLQAIFQTYRPASHALEPAAKLGVMARQDLADTLAQQIQAARQTGAQWLGTEGGRLGHSNAFLPGILTNIDSHNPIYRQELFGPVASVWIVKDEAQAIELANDTPFGLGTSIWTNDRTRAHELALELEVGNVAVNQIVKSDPRLPFGGIKHSGIGRELGQEGIKEFVNVKTIVIGRPSCC